MKKRFKIGDKVRLTTGRDHGMYERYKGDTLIVKGYDDYPSINGPIVFCSQGLSCFESRLELVSEYEEEDWV